MGILVIFATIGDKENFPVAFNSPNLEPGITKIGETLYHM